VRKLAFDTSRAAIVIVIRTGRTIPHVVPVARIGHGLELDLRVVKKRTTVYRLDLISLVALSQENDHLVKCLPCFGRVGVFLEPGRSRSLREWQTVSLGGFGLRQGERCKRTDTSQGELEVSPTRLATTKARLMKLGVKGERAASTLLSGIISMEYLTHHWAALRDEGQILRF
jgi:hypothetical protein